MMASPGNRLWLLQSQKKNRFPPSDSCSTAIGIVGRTFVVQFTGLWNIWVLRVDTEEGISDASPL
jgi:nicotinamide riboside transporter PnuC